MSLQTHYRTNTCGELTAKDVKKTIKLAGWVHTRRDHGGIIFIDIRDRYGITQIVFDPNITKDFHIAESLRREDIINVEGAVEHRKEGMVNPKLKTGEIEIYIEKVVILSKVEVPPMEVDDRVIANEDIRLKYRYIDLRRPIMQENLAFRHTVSICARKYFESHGFLEVETPLLVKPTPEGARDYIVPSRVNPGHFFALPQSPQLYKQILMISGCDRYFQFARCLRDEDLRADRQPEHTQMDLEMSFVESKDIMEFVEGLFKHVLKETKNYEIKDKFIVLTHKESMDKYGIDKPDIRFSLELCEVTDIVVKSDFGVFKDVKTNGGIVKCIAPEKDMSRNDIDKYIAFCQTNGAKGMAWMRVTKDGTGLESNIAKYFPIDVQKELIEKIKAKPGAILMFIADKKSKCNEILAKLRIQLGHDLGLINPTEFKFCWVVDFPLFAWDEEAQIWCPEHHMFSMPKKDCLHYLDTDPGKVLGDLYDITMNGVELGSGSIRINLPDIQKKVMKIIGLSEEEAMQKFGFLLEAYKYGGPPHGGMGLGLDRFVALMRGTNDIREVIAFPKNKSAQCPMDGSPGLIDAIQLKETHIKVDIVKPVKK